MRAIGATVVLGACLVAFCTAGFAADKPAAKTADKPAAKTADKPAGKAEEKFVAKVNGVGIPRAQFERNWEYFLRRSGIPGSHSEKAGQLDEMRQQVLDRLVDEELLFQESKKLKRLAGPDLVEAEIVKARGQFPTPEAFGEALKQNGLDEKELRGLLSRNLSIQGLVEKEFTKGLSVTDTEIHDFYAGNKEKFNTPEQAHARHILVKVEEKADEPARKAARAKADDLLAQLKAGANFEELAKKNSDCPSAPRGGDLDFFGHGQMVPAFDQAAFALQPGELSGVVETQFGYHIIKLEEKKPAGMVPETEVAPKIREYLLAQKTDAAVEAQVKILRGKAKIERIP